jgi:glycosyltransferase involved in cell wall biosynthesis
MMMKLPLSQKSSTALTAMLSIILLSYYSRNRIPDAYFKVRELMESNDIPFEFIIMDDGSEDESYAVALELEKGHENVRAYQLSRNYSSTYSAFAGLSVCSGKCATIIVDDEQQPYSTLVEMYRLWEKGEKVIIPYRTKRNDGFFTNLSARTFYGFINRISEVKFPSGGADTFLIDRELIELLNEKIHPINTAIVTEVLRLGFSPCLIPYERSRSKNSKSRWSFRKKFRFFKDIFFSGSTWPIRVITWMGILFAFFALCMIIFYSYIAIFGNPDFWGQRLPGWTSTVVIIAFFSGLILFSLGIIAEYIWRIYEEVKGRPGYIIRKKEDDKKSQAD